MPQSYAQPNYLSPSRPHLKAATDRWPPGLALVVIFALSCTAWIGVVQFARLVVTLVG